MGRFIYSVWFLDTAAFPDDQDREWVACLSIEAANAQQAQEWGDELARDRVKRIPDEIFVSSSVELERVGSNEDMRSVPRIALGQRPSDQELGW